MGKVKKAEKVKCIPHVLWHPIAKYDNEKWRRVDLWLSIAASPRSFGVADAFRVTDAYLQDGKWVHFVDGQVEELFADYITHFMERPAGPNGESNY